MMNYIIPLHEFNRVVQDDASVEYPMDSPIEQNDEYIRDYSYAEQFMYYTVLIVLKHDARFKTLEFERLQVFKKNKRTDLLLLNDIFDDKKFFDAFELFTGQKFMNRSKGVHYCEFMPEDLDSVLENLQQYAPESTYVKILESIIKKVKTSVRVEFSPFTDNDIPGVKIKH